MCLSDVKRLVSVKYKLCKGIAAQKIQFHHLQVNQKQPMCNGISETQEMFGIHNWYLQIKSVSSALLIIS